VLCKQCRTANRDDATFCSACGAPMGRAVATTPKPPAADPAARKRQVTAAVIALIVGLVFLLLALCVGGGLVLFRWLNTPQPPVAAPSLPTVPPPAVSKATVDTPTPISVPDTPPTPVTPEPAPEPAPYYVLPDSADRVIPASELDGMSTQDLCLARNEIFARHGLVFQSPPLRDHFESQSWYTGETTSQATVESALSPTERQNVARIKAVEARRGSKYLKGTFSQW
jgi:hypothetical protein